MNNKNGKLQKDSVIRKLRLNLRITNHLFGTALQRDKNNNLKYK